MSAYPLLQRCSGKMMSKSLPMVVNQNSTVDMAVFQLGDLIPSANFSISGCAEVCAKIVDTESNKMFITKFDFVIQLKGGELFPLGQVGTISKGVSTTWNQAAMINSAIISVPTYDLVLDSVDNKKVNLRITVPSTVNYSQVMVNAKLNINQ